MDEFNKKPVDETTEPFQVIDTKEPAELKIDSPNPKSKSFFKEIISYVVLIGVAFVLATVIHTYVFTPVTVSGESMMDTLHNNDYLFLWELSQPKRFDIVVFKVTPEQEQYCDPTAMERSQDYFIKRVIGLPGENVYVQNNTLFINNREVPEPFITKYTSSFTLQDICDRSNLSCPVVNGQTTIPSGYYLVLGDNRPNSCDSRTIGLVPKSSVMGKALFILYPFDRIKDLGD